MVLEDSRIKNIMQQNARKEKNKVKGENKEKEDDCLCTHLKFLISNYGCTSLLV